MSTQNSTLSNSIFRQRSVRFLIIAAVILVGVLLVRTTLAMFNWGAQPTAYMMPVEEMADSTVRQIEETLERNPNDTGTYAQLGMALLQQVRANGDSAGYAKAEMAFSEALEREPENVDAMVGMGVLELARHQFDDSLAWGEKARALNPFRADIVGIIVDSQVELGRYDEAAVSVQEMVDLRPGPNSYPRVSYVRELYGDIPGAIEAMQTAEESGVPGIESTLWAGYQLGELYLKQGDLKTADKIFAELLDQQPTYAYGHAGRAQVLTAQGKYQPAITIYEDIIERMPMPGFLMQLGGLYELTGQPQKAAEQFAAVREGHKADLETGMNEQLEVAMFELEYGEDPAYTLEWAEISYAMRPNIYAEDTMAWALYQMNRPQEAWEYSQRSLRLNTQDPRFYYHAGVIAHELGKEEKAIEYLTHALEINPYFSVDSVAHAETILSALQ